MKIKAVIHEAEEGGYWAEVPALGGCYTQGESIPEVIENLKEVIGLYEDIDPPLTDSRISYYRDSFMKSISGKKLLSILLQRGWHIVRTKGSHYRLQKDNRSLSIPVHGNDDLKIGLLRNIMREAELTDNDLTLIIVD